MCDVDFYVYITTGCLCMFVYVWMMSISCGNRPIESISSLEVLLDSRLEYESLEGLIDFVVFLVPKLWPKVWKLIGEILAISCQKSFLCLEFFFITFEPEILESQSMALKTRIIAQNPIKL